MSWHGWSLGTPLLYVVMAALLYWAGGRRGRRGRSGRPGRPGRGRGRPQPLRSGAFAAGLLTIVVALDSPLDGAADTLFWVHMVQHVLLLTVAPPLILLGSPWPRMWRALPLAPRTRLARALARSSAAAPVRRLARPLPAWLLFNATMLAWHLPGAYDATLRSAAVHQLEHATFFFTALLFWARVVDPGPLRPRLTWPGRVTYVVGAMVVSWALAVALVLSQHPLYEPYAALASRPGGITALADQQLAGGVMWVLGSISYSVAVFVGLYRWLEPQPPAAARTPAVPA